MYMVAVCTKMAPIGEYVLALHWLVTYVALSIAVQCLNMCSLALCSANSLLDFDVKQELGP